MSPGVSRLFSKRPGFSPSSWSEGMIDPLAGRKRLRTLRPLCFFLVVMSLAQGHAYGQINSPGARTLFARRFMYRSDWRVIRLSKLLSDGNQIANPEKREVQVVAWENFFVYGLPHNTTAIGILPLVTRSISFLSEAESRSFRDTALADPVFLLQYDGLYQKNRPGGFTRLGGFFGVKPPWGQEPFSSESADLLQGLLFTHSDPRWFFNADFQWVATTKSGSFEAGDVFQYDGSVMYRLLTYPEWKDLFLVLELNAISELTAEQDGTKLANTGGNTIFLSPGVEFFIKPNLALEFSAQIPVYQGLHGTQLGRNFALVTGFRFVY